MSLQHHYGTKHPDPPYAHTPTRCRKARRHAGKRTAVFTCKSSTSKATPRHIFGLNVLLLHPIFSLAPLRNALTYEGGFSMWMLRFESTGYLSEKKKRVVGRSGMCHVVLCTVHYSSCAVHRSQGMAVAWSHMHMLLTQQARLQGDRYRRTRHHEQGAPIAAMKKTNAGGIHGPVQPVQPVRVQGNRTVSPTVSCPPGGRPSRRRCPGEGARKAEESTGAQQGRRKHHTSGFKCAQQAKREEPEQSAHLNPRQPDKPLKVHCGLRCGLRCGGVWGCAGWVVAHLWRGWLPCGFRCTCFDHTHVTPLSRREDLARFPLHRRDFQPQKLAVKLAAARTAMAINSCERQPIAKKKNCQQGVDHQILQHLR